MSSNHLCVTIVHFKLLLACFRSQHLLNAVYWNLTVHLMLYIECEEEVGKRGGGGCHPAIVHLPPTCAAALHSCFSEWSKYSAVNEANTVREKPLYFSPGRERRGNRWDLRLPQTRTVQAVDALHQALHQALQHHQHHCLLFHLRISSTSCRQSTTSTRRRHFLPPPTSGKSIKNRKSSFTRFGNFSFDICGIPAEKQLAFGTFFHSFKCQF